MSLKPYTSLVVSQRNADVIGKQADVVYMLAPALSGGAKLDDEGNLMYDKSGAQLFATSDAITSLNTFEAEFGSAASGSPASIYAKWIYDHGNFSIRCRRIVGGDLDFASVLLQDDYGQDVLKITSSVQEASGNQIMVDVDSSDGIEAFLYSTNAYFESGTKKLHIGKEYLTTDVLTFKGKSEGETFFVDFFGDTRNEFELFNWGSILKAEDLQGNQYEYVAGIPTGKQFAYDSVAKQFKFGEVIHGKITINVFTAEGDIVNYIFYVNSDVIAFDSNSITFDALYLNGVGAVNDITFNKYLRFYNESPVRDSFVAFEETFDGKKQVILRDGVRTETYELTTPLELVTEINLRSRIVAADVLTNETFVAEYFAEKQIPRIGFKITAYDGATVSLYDNLQCAEDVAAISTGLIRATVIGRDCAVPAISLGNQLSGGSSGLDVTLADYLEGIYEASSLNDVTIMIAPGVDDETLHALLGEHCQEMFAHGKYRTSFGGVALGESFDDKIKRTERINNERFSLIGDGLQLRDPVTGAKKMFSGSIAVTAFVGLLLSQTYYTSLTEQLVKNAYNVEHHYDDAQLEVLHEARMVTFYFDSGVKVVDAITTSTLNAYEDIHMVRIFDAISYSLRVVMLGSVGEVNMPPRWGFILSKIQKYLEALKDVGAIVEFKILNEVRPEDIVSKRFKFRVGVIPVFPVKYIEGFVDIVPPTFVQV